MLASKRPWEVLLLLAFIAVWQWASHAPPAPPEVPSPCPPEVRAQWEALGRNLRKTPQWEKWGERSLRGEWVIVRYTVDRSGKIGEVQLETSQGDPELVLEATKACAPVPPLPDGVGSLEVVELFWDLEAARFSPGSLGEQLHQLDEDGRWIRVRATAGTHP